MSDKPNILVICGPTASGKTALAVELALRLNGEVVSADSMQVYRGMDIGTAKPTQAERRGVPHHMLDVADPWENYSVARYVQDAVPIVDAILARGRLPIVAGGTGLYLDALVAGREFAPFTPAAGLREELQARAQSQGLPVLRAELERIDPEAAGRIHPNDEKRTIRALEVWYSTGKTISQHNAETRALPNRYAPLTIGLNLCAVFFAAFAVASAVFFALPPAFSVFAYCFLMRCFCQKREMGLECASAGLSCNAF